MAASSEPDDGGQKEHASDLLFPEILPRESLIAILQERKVQHKDFVQLEKHQLVDLFHKFVTPLPQRQYRDNRRGKKMTQLRLKQESLKRKEEATKSQNDEPRYKSQKTCESSPTDRLKPPPAAINWERKVIKLTPSDARTTNSSLQASSPEIQRNSTQKTTIDDPPCATSQMPNSTSSTASSIVLTPTTTRKLKLKRTSEDDSTNGKNNEIQEPSPPETSQKKKHNPITWP